MQKEKEMIIDGKEYGLLYSIGARCDYDDFVMANQEKMYSYTHGLIMRAVFMSRAYAAANGGDALTYEQIRALPNRELDILMDEMNKQIEIDSKVTVEAEESKPKKAKSPEQSN